MAKGSDSPFPSVLLVIGSAPTAPTSGLERLFIDSADGLLKLIDSSSTITPIDSPTAPVSKAVLAAGKLSAHATFR